MATDISKDGTLTGPNFEMYDEIAKNKFKFNLLFQVELKILIIFKKVAEKDYYACIVGKAYYEKKVDLKETITMLTKRIIPCLDIKDGKVVKGVNFVGLKDVGDPIELAKKYDVQCADEVVFLDITASYEDRGIMKDIIERGASELTIPLAVGGGIRTLDDFRMILSLRC